MNDNGSDDRSSGRTTAADSRWLDEPRNVTMLVYGLVAVGIALVLADFFYAKHPHFDFQRWFGFYAVFGFTVSVSLVLGAKQLRRILRRDEDYYEPLDENCVDNEERDDGA